MLAEKRMTSSSPRIEGGSCCSFRQKPGERRVSKTFKALLPWRPAPVEDTASREITQSLNLRLFDSEKKLSVKKDIKKYS